MAFGSYYWVFIQLVRARFGKCIKSGIDAERSSFHEHSHQERYLMLDVEFRALGFAAPGSEGVRISAF